MKTRNTPPLHPSTPLDVELAKPHPDELADLEKKIEEGESNRPRRSNKTGENDGIEPGSGGEAAPDNLPMSTR